MTKTRRQKVVRRRRTWTVQRARKRIGDIVEISWEQSELRLDTGYYLRAMRAFVAELEGQRVNIGFDSLRELHPTSGQGVYEYYDEALVAICFAAHAHGPSDLHRAWRRTAVRYLMPLDEQLIRDGVEDLSNPEWFFLFERWKTTFTASADESDWAEHATAVYLHAIARLATPADFDEPLEVERALDLLDELDDVYRMVSETPKASISFVTRCDLAAREWVGSAAVTNEQRLRLAWELIRRSVRETRKVPDNGYSRMRTLVLASYLAGDLAARYDGRVQARLWRARELASAVEAVVVVGGIEEANLTAAEDALECLLESFLVVVEDSPDDTELRERYATTVRTLEKRAAESGEAIPSISAHVEALESLQDAQG